MKYGSKKVNTGYRFDASSSPYIDNNVFREGIDSIDQSIYYKYPYGVSNAFGDNVLFAYPGPLVDEANLPTYKLFNTSGEIKTTEGVMTPHWYPAIYQNDVAYVYSINNTGYQFMNVWWEGLRTGVWQDGFPKLQCHSDDNKGVDGKNILVKFNGFKQTSYGKVSNTETRTFWNEESYSDSTIDATKVNYLLSDDHLGLKQIIGSNCYYDNPIPAIGYGGSYIKVINRIPSFSRATYDYSLDYNNNPAFYVAGYQNKNITGTSNVVTLKYNAYYVTNVSTSTGRQYAYFTNYMIDRNHKYFLVASVKASATDSTKIRTGNDYAHPDIIGSTLIDKKDLAYGTDSVQLIASIVETGDQTLTQIVPLSTYDVSDSVTWETYYLVAYDLTEIGLDNVLTTVDDAILYFGVTNKKVGYTYNLTYTLDFGISRELYVPYCTYEKNIGIYNKYWKNYIADVYSRNTRVMECYCFLDNIDKVFRGFYYYDNCTWILSKIVDWNMETKYCKATFIKVNDIMNYITS